MLTLRGVPFESVANASGARNFDGKGYPFHRFLPGLDFTGSTFVAKTTTLEPREGNMPLAPDGRTPLDFKPACIKVYPWKRMTLNAVGLSGPGAEVLLASEAWRTHPKPFFISFMSVKKEPEERLAELSVFKTLLARHAPSYRSPVGLQVNFSCPNVGLHRERIVGEILQALDLLGSLNMPITIKLNALTAVSDALHIGAHPVCDALCMGNTIPWGEMPDAINWQRLFGTDVSPLAHLGGGGLSGAPLLPIVTGWIKNARAAGFQKPIIACGGILSTDDVDQVIEAGTHAIELGCVAILRPWRVAGLIRYAKVQFQLLELVNRKELP